YMEHFGCFARPIFLEDTITIDLELARAKLELGPIDGGADQVVGPFLFPELGKIAFGRDVAGGFQGLELAGGTEMVGDAPVRFTAEPGLERTALGIILELLQGAGEFQHDLLHNILRLKVGKPVTTGGVVNELPVQLEK